MSTNLYRAIAKQEISGDSNSYISPGENLSPPSKQLESRRKLEVSPPTLNIHWKDWCWSWSSNPLATWWRADSLEKTLMLGLIEGKRRRRWQRMRWLDSITNSIHVNMRKLWEIVKDGIAWCARVHGVTKSWTQLGNWTTTTPNN